MKWYSVKKYKPTSNSGECLVVTDEQDLWIATFKYYDEIEEYAWIAENDGWKLNSVTHFCIIDPIEIDG